MPAIHHVTGLMAEAERTRRVYAGEIIVFRGFEPVMALVEVLRAHCRTHLGEDPETVHERVAESRLNELAETLRNAVREDDEVATRLKAALASVGVDPEVTYADGIYQRVQMAGSRSDRRMLGALAAHRDTWGTNIMAQTNWWAPTWPTTPERTLALFPGYFERALANDSAGWDFAELLRRLRVQGPEPDYPLLPLATTSLHPAAALPISLVPGDLMCFSGAHLHASVPNDSDRTRLSFELRTVNARDVEAGQGAPNLDGHAVRTTYQLFRAFSDGTRLGRMI